VWDDVVVGKKRKIFEIRRGRPRPPRRRRTPEAARQELLDAAEQVFGEFNPDQVGLVDIAREAGVSHALITHYFGTYAGLVEATLERRIRRLREQILTKLREAGALSRPSDLIGLLFRALEDPVHVRLVKWMLASDRPSAANAFALQDQGLQHVAFTVANAIDPDADRRTIEKIELALLTAVAAAYGYAITKYALAGSIGRGMSPQLDIDVQQTLAGMLRAYLRAELGPVIPAA